MVSLVQYVEELKQLIKDEERKAQEEKRKVDQAMIELMKQTDLLNQVKEQNRLIGEQVASMELTKKTLTDGIQKKQEVLSDMKKGLFILMDEESKQKDKYERVRTLMISESQKMLSEFEEKMQQFSYQNVMARTEQLKEKIDRQRQLISEMNNQQEDQGESNLEKKQLEEEIAILKSKRDILLERKRSIVESSSNTGNDRYGELRAKIEEMTASYNQTSQIVEEMFSEVSKKYGEETCSKCNARHIYMRSDVLEEDGELEK